MPAEENAKQLPHSPEIHTQQLIEIRADVTKILIEKENRKKILMGTLLRSISLYGYTILVQYEGICIILPWFLTGDT